MSPSPTEIHRELAEGAQSFGLPCPVRWVPETTSTNDVVKDWALDGAPHGTVLWAEHQTSGRGRLGRRWIPAPGNLYLSILLRPRLPTALAPWVCLASAVAVVETVPQTLGIKWPNDVLTPSGEKVAGLLAEMDAGRDGVRWIVLGVGLNTTTRPPEEPGAGVVEPPVRRRGIFVCRLVRAILDEVERLRRDPAAVRERWRTRSVTLGRTVRVGEVEGIAEDILEDGALWIRTASGRRTCVRAGDVQMIGPPSPPS